MKAAIIAIVIETSIYQVVDVIRVCGGKSSVINFWRHPKKSADKFRYAIFIKFYSKNER